MNLSGHEGEIPISMTSSYAVHGHQSNRPPPTAANNGAEDADSKRMVVAGISKRVNYRECLKNHAASMGGNATDGCGEFMPGGENGTVEAFKCSACGCHRNFHRRESEGDQPYSSSYYHHGHLLNARGGGGGYGGGYVGRAAAGPPALIMPLGAAMHTSESEEMETGGGGGGAGAGARKRFRTKFTQEQKEKMLAFAERVSWRLQRQEEGLVQQFCQEIGVRRRVLKVWMHNNKHNFANKNAAPAAASAAIAPPPFRL